MPIRPQSYGSADTALKLEIILKYLRAYLILMRKQRFRLSYIDAFAGSGVWRRPGSSDTEAGSAMAVLRMEPASRFNRYVFGDIKRGNVQSLTAAIARDREMGLDLPPPEAISVLRQNANDLIAVECSRLAKYPMDRAVMFVDPFGMAVNWATVERVAATGKVDLWLLVPTGMGPARLMTHKNIPDSWRTKLNAFWGDSEWEAHFFHAGHDLFGGPAPYRNAPVPRITEFALNKLRSVFGEMNVHRTGLPLTSANGQRAFLLTFACANKNKAAYEPAIRIANDILGKARRPRS